MYEQNRNRCLEARIRKDIKPMPSFVLSFVFKVIFSSDFVENAFRPAVYEDTVQLTARLAAVDCVDN